LDQELLDFYQQAKRYVLEQGYVGEIAWANNVDFKDMDSWIFFEEYCWVVVNSGMMWKIARQIFDRFKETIDPSKIGHPGKRAAIKEVFGKRVEHFTKLTSLNDTEKIEYLETLPWIGEITKYHLAKNLGINCAKPDRHLQRLAVRYGYGQDVQKMCIDLSKATGDRVITVDLVLWRNSTPK